VLRLQVVVRSLRMREAIERDDEEISTGRVAGRSWCFAPSRSGSCSARYLQSRTLFTRSQTSACLARTGGVPSENRLRLARLPAKRVQIVVSARLPAVL